MNLESMLNNIHSYERHNEVFIKFLKCRARNMDVKCLGLEGKMETASIEHKIPP